MLTRPLGPYCPAFNLQQPGTAWTIHSILAYRDTLVIVLLEFFQCAIDLIPLISVVVLKAKSPSCGVGEIYDGTFTGTLREGDGVTTALLRKIGVKVYSEIEIKIASGEN